MDIKNAEAYVDELVLAPALSTGLLCTDSMKQLQDGALKLNTIVALMNSQEEEDSSAIESARKSVRSSLGRVSESWGLSGEMSPIPKNAAGQRDSAAATTEEGTSGRTSGCKRIMSPPVLNSSRTPQSMRHRRKQSRSLSPSASPSPLCVPRLTFANDEGGADAHSAQRPCLGAMGPQARGTLPSFLFSQEDHSIIDDEVTVDVTSPDGRDARLMCAQTQADCEEECVAEWSNQPSGEMQDTTRCAQEDPDPDVDDSTQALPTSQPFGESIQAGHDDSAASPRSFCRRAGRRSGEEASATSQATVHGLTRTSLPAACAAANPTRLATSAVPLPHDALGRQREFSLSMLDAREAEGMRGMMTDTRMPASEGGAGDEKGSVKQGSEDQLAWGNASDVAPPDAERQRCDAVEEVWDDSLDLEQVQRLEDEALARKSVGGGDTRWWTQEDGGGVDPGGGEADDSRAGAGDGEADVATEEEDYVSETDEEELEAPASPVLMV